MRLPVVVALLASGACARGVAIQEGDDQPGTPDAGTPAIDAAPGSDAPGATGMPDGPTGPGPTATSLLLTEVVLAPTTQEFIEIANPTSQAVDLSTYYLSDNGNYFRLPAGAPTLDSGDFVVTFPAGASIAPGAVITVALDTAANYMAVYGTAPTYSVASATMTVIASNGVSTLTNGGELVALFSWSGTTDTVKDVDLVLAGAPTIANGLVDKSGVAQDGPDAGTTTTAYAADAKTMAVMGSTPASGKSTKRLVREVGHETQAGGGNGISGDDETSEDTAATWDSSGFTNPTPGAVPAAVLQ
jgi:hypothetical protein